MKEQKFNHFIQRIKERYNLDITLQDLYEIAKIIKSGKAKLTRANARSFQYKLRYQGKLLLVILNRSHSNFVTALPIAKNNERTTFYGKQFSYIDALYINHQYSKCFAKNKENNAFCPKCGYRSIIVNLGKERFQCERCHSLFQFKELKMPQIFIGNQMVNNQYQPMLNLNIDLWWYFYKNEVALDLFEDYQLKAIFLEDLDSDFAFSLSNKSKVLLNKDIVIPFGIYTVQQIKEKITNDRKV